MFNKSYIDEASYMYLYLCYVVLSLLGFVTFLLFLGSRVCSLTRRTAFTRDRS